LKIRLGFSPCLGLARGGCLVIIALLLACAPLCAQAPPQAQATPPQPAANDVSGMYTFLREGEFLEVDVESGGRVTGFVSRYGDSDSDRGAFLDHMFTKAAIDRNQLTFTTRSVHGVSYEFKGTLERGEGKTPSAEGYYVIKGTLTQVTEDKNHKPSAQSREVVFKSFPADALSPPPKKD
jgi:hypothetical protein